MFVGLLQGILIGILVSVPLGPIGLVTIEHTIMYGPRRGYMSALLIASIDTIAVCMILFGLHHAIGAVHVPIAVRIIGSVIIFFYGTHLAFGKRAVAVAVPRAQTFLEIVLIIVSNPATYISFGIMNIFFAPLIHRSIAVHVAAVIGFVVAAFGWWILLVALAKHIKKSLPKMALVHRIIGIGIMLSALYMLIGGAHPIIHHLFAR